MPRPDKEIRPFAHASIDARRRDLARAIIDGQEPYKAGQTIGMSRDAVAQTLNHAAFAMAIRVELQRFLNNLSAPMAVKVLHELASDKSVLPSVRRQAASDILDRSGHIAPKATERDTRPETAPLSDMSTDALQTLVNRLETELAARARPVQGVSDGLNGPISGHVSDKALKALED